MGPKPYTLFHLAEKSPQGIEIMPFSKLSDAQKKRHLKTLAELVLTGRRWKANELQAFCSLLMDLSNHNRWTTYHEKVLRVIEGAKPTPPSVLQKATKDPMTLSESEFLSVLGELQQVSAVHPTNEAPPNNVTFPVPPDLSQTPRKLAKKEQK